MRTLAIASLAALAGCATTQTAGSGPSDVVHTTRVESSTSTAGATSLAASGAAENVAGTVRFSVDQVWRVLPAVYDSLGIPLTTLDAGSHFIGNEGMKVRHELGKTSLNTYIDCGRTQGPPSADTYEIHLEVTTRVQPGPSGPGTSTLVTKIDAMGRPVGLGSDWVHCSSRGVLERAIVESVQGRATR